MENSCSKQFTNTLATSSTSQLYIEFGLKHKIRGRVRNNRRLPHDNKLFLEDSLRIFAAIVGSGREGPDETAERLLLRMGTELERHCLLSNLAFLYNRCGINCESVRSIVNYLNRHHAATRFDLSAATSNVRPTTLLHIAFRRGNKALAELLLSSGADPNARDRAGNTVLHLAVQTSNTDWFELLARYCDPHVKNKRGLPCSHNGRMFAYSRSIAWTMFRFAQAFPGADLTVPVTLPDCYRSTAKFGAYRYDFTIWHWVHTVEASAIVFQLVKKYFMFLYLEEELVPDVRRLILSSVFPVELFEDLLFNGEAKEPEVSHDLLTFYAEVNAMKRC